MIKEKFSALLPHLIVLIGFVVIAFLYAKPVLDGKVLGQHDVIQAKGSAQEIMDYKEKNNRYPLWTNSMFSGMPSYTIQGEFPNSYTARIAQKITYILPSPVDLIFLMLAGAYLMCVFLGFNIWQSLLGAVTFCFASYNFIIIEAGHISKVQAIAYAPLVFAGIILLYKGRWIVGTLLFSIAMIFELYVNHVQITYYLGIALLLYVTYELVEAIKKKEFKTFIYASVISLTIAGLSLGSMASRFWTTYEYSKYTIRGGAELKGDDANKSTGLDKDYAFSWSYGPMETFTFLVPDFFGGSSKGELDKKSNTYEAMMGYGVGKSEAEQFVKNISGYGGQLYWGSQPNTSGPAYLGAIVCFLFVLGMFLIRSSLKWWILGTITLFTMLSWGKNFELLTDPFFYYFPLFNKFRAVTMIHSIVSLLMVFVAVWGLAEFVKRKSDLQTVKHLKYSLIGFAGLLVFLWLLGPSMFSFEKEPEYVIEGGKAIAQQTSDDQFKSILQQVTNNKPMAEDLFNAFIEDRISAFRTDVLRTLFFIVVAGALLWAFALNKLKENVMCAVLIAFATLDMWSVSKRYLNNDDFQRKSAFEESIAPSQADLMVMQDKDLSYRVMNNTVSTFNDATTSIYHKSIGGYSAAKIRRYQDLIERQISKGNMAVLNMLNTKYFITSQKDQQGKESAAFPQMNPGALGNAWFVDEIKWAKTPDGEMQALDSLNPSKVAIVSESYRDIVQSNFAPTDSLDMIKLTEYHPDKLIYESNTQGNRLAVFSEIYYNSGLGWNAYLDGKLVDHFRVNYLLRGMIVPAGKHKIEYKFEPQSYYKGEMIALISSILLFAGIGGCIFMLVKNKEGKKEGDLL